MGEDIQGCAYDDSSHAASRFGGLLFVRLLVRFCSTCPSRMVIRNSTPVFNSVIAVACRALDSTLQKAYAALYDLAARL